jgi:hypothetical protein
MDNELELDLNEDNKEEEINRKDSRIKSLSDKVKTTSEERDTLAKAKAEAEAKAEAAQKDADFYKGFNTVSTKYAGANEYQDKIREKVALGLDVEEATMLIMAKEGKYTPPTQPLVRESAAGGSASTGIADTVEKSYREMSRSDLKAGLQELESKGTKLL